jgi:hypothetical protein
MTVAARGGRISGILETMQRVGSISYLKEKRLLEG